MHNGGEYGIRVFVKSLERIGRDCGFLYDPGERPEGVWPRMTRPAANAAQLSKRSDCSQQKGGSFYNARLRF